LRSRDSRIGCGTLIKAFSIYENQTRELLRKNWSGRRESNPYYQLGKLKLDECLYCWRKHGDCYTWIHHTSLDCGILHISASSKQRLLNARDCLLSDRFSRRESQHCRDEELEKRSWYPGSRIAGLLLHMRMRRLALNETPCLKPIEFHPRGLR
jgi:hypothetical protein